MAKNVLGTELETCGTDPLTGFYRDGCCNTGASDAGIHVVCSVMTAEFLDFQQGPWQRFEHSESALPIPGITAGGSMVPLCRTMERSL